MALHATATDPPKQYSRKPRSTPMLPWKDCGFCCNCRVFTIGDAEYTISKLLGDGPYFYLLLGHENGRRHGKYGSLEEADAAAREHAAPEFKKLKKLVKKLEPCFSKR